MTHGATRDKKHNTKNLKIILHQQANWAYQKKEHKKGVLTCFLNTWNTKFCNNLLEKIFTLIKFSKYSEH
jgi:hypothetical protein